MAYEGRCLHQWTGRKDKEINEAKKIAAFEITKLIHGEDEAIKVRDSAEALFESNKNSENMPTIKIDNALINNSEISILDVIVNSNVAPSKGQARTLIAQGGISINDEKITDVNYLINLSDFSDKYFILKKGKKTFIKILF